MGRRERERERERTSKRGEVGVEKDSVEKREKKAKWRERGGGEKK